MGLLTILKKLKQKEKQIRLLMLGLDNAGKTTILKKINGEDIDEISPTLGFNIKTLEFSGYKLNFWDVIASTLYLGRRTDFNQIILEKLF
jgi:ADP-ribosylation factor-like protein 2